MPGKISQKDGDFPIMSSTREDSVLTSIQEIQNIEAERVREHERRVKEAESARILQLEHARAETARREVERAQALENEQRAEQRHRESEIARSKELREIAELRLRAEADKTRSARLEAQAEAHAIALASIREDGARGVRPVGVMLAAIATVCAVAVGGYWGVYRPMQATHAREIAMLRSQQDQASAARAQAQRDTVALEDQIRAARQRAIPVVPVISTENNARPTPHVRRNTPSTRVTSTNHAAEIGPIDLNEGPDPLSNNDDTRRQPAPRR
jgi:hypothetical protein